MSDTLITSAAIAVVETCSSRTYFEGVKQQADGLCFDWACRPQDLEIWFGNSPDGTGEHPNFQIEVTGQPERIQKFYWSGKANHRQPERYKRGYLRGPYTYGWLLDRIATMVA